MSEPAATGEIRPGAYRFGAFELRLPSRELLRDGEPIELQPKVFDLVAFLLLNRDRVVDKNELLDAVWPKQVVTEAALTRCAMKARRALDDDAESPRIIQTLHGRGYRFIAEAAPVIERRATARAAHAEAADVAPPPAARHRQPWPALAMLVATALALALFMGWQGERAGQRGLDAAGPVRLAILPVENATGDPRHDWARLGLMTAIGEILRVGHNVFVLGAREVTTLVDGASATDLPDRLSRLREGHGITHVLQVRLESQLGRFRLHYRLSGPDGGARERTVVAADIPGLAHAAGADLGVLLGSASGQTRAEAISNDTFANEAYLRGRALRVQGDVRGALELFRLASEQVPESFWPRYEIALAQRDLGEHAQAAAQLERLIEEADAGDDLAQRMGARNALAIVRWREGDNTAAARLLGEALELAEQLGDPNRKASVLTNLGILDTYRNEYRQARDWLHRAIEAETAAGLERTSGNVLNSLAQIDLREGDLVSAATHLDAALTQFRLVGERRNEAIALNALSGLRRREGRMEESRNLAAHALQIHRELGNRTAEASALIALAIAEAQLGNLRTAMTHAQAALDIADAIGERPNAATARSLLGQFSLDLGDHAAARRWLDEALAIMRETDDPGGVRTQRLWLARLALATDAPGEAQRQASALLADTPDDDAILRANTRHLLAKIRLRLADPAGAAEEALRAIALASTLNQPRLLARLRTTLAEARLAAGDDDAAADLLAQVRELLPDDPDRLRVEAALAAARGDPAAALAHEQAARTQAGERWSARDQARLEARERAVRAGE